MISLYDKQRVGDCPFALSVIYDGARAIDMIKQKHVLVVQDISCVGKCSLTVALPIISVMGATASALPTAVLSTHTAFPGAVLRELSGDIRRIIAHWETIDIQFDAIYTGYLGGGAELSLIHELFDAYPGAVKLVDPVMADNGRLYRGFTRDYAAGMRELCARADIIVPNMTETFLLLDSGYAEPPYTKSYVEDVISRLREIMPGNIVLTGLSFEQDSVGAAVYDGSIGYAMAKRQPGYYHGTGDIFASVLIGAYLRGSGLTDAALIAARFTAEAIEKTGVESRFGVNFEAALPMLL